MESAKAYIFYSSSAYFLNIWTSGRSSMSVFISFDSEESQLAYQLRDIMEKRGIECYLFVTERTYDLSTYQKITDAIHNSYALVAVVTNRPSSASVHQEIGYAMAKGTPVIVMLESGADDGILTHGREKEVFTRDDFQSSCEVVVKYLQTSVSKVAFAEDSTQFLEERKLIPVERSDFGRGGNALKLSDSRIQDLTLGSPAVLFSACPTKLFDEIPVTSPEYHRRLDNLPDIVISGCPIRFLGGERKTQLKQVTYYYESSTNFSRYLEMRSNGFVEHGVKAPLIYGFDPDGVGTRPFLHSCWTAAAFNAFLVFCKHHYEYHECAGDIDVFLSIRGASWLTLMGFGGRNNGVQYPEPWEIDWTTEPPTTETNSVSISRKIRIKDLSVEKIGVFVHKFANDIANVYGMDQALCYNTDGTINADLIPWMKY